jgi:hypothetical protein
LRLLNSTAQHSTAQHSTAQHMAERDTTHGHVHRHEVHSQYARSAALYVEQHSSWLGDTHLALVTTCPEGASGSWAHCAAMTNLALDDPTVKTALHVSAQASMDQPWQWLPRCCLHYPNLRMIAKLLLLRLLFCCCCSVVTRCVHDSYKLCCHLLDSRWPVAARCSV